MPTRFALDGRSHSFRPIRMSIPHGGKVEDTVYMPRLERFKAAEVMQGVADLIDVSDYADEVKELSRSTCQCDEEEME